MRIFPNCCRTLIKTISTGNLSETSFDRRSSGKYSFRIPRPFSTYSGQKEYEGEHLSIHNSEFDPSNSTRQKNLLITPYIEGGGDGSEAGTHSLSTFTSNDHEQTVGSNHKETSGSVTSSVHYVSTNDDNEPDLDSAIASSSNSVINSDVEHAFPERHQTNEGARNEP